MTRPIRYLLQSLCFLALIAVFSFALRVMLIHSFFENPGLNGLILAILFLGICWNLRLVLRLIPEVHWVQIIKNPRARLSAPPPPKLLAPMAGLLTSYQQRHDQAPLLPHQTTNSLLDSLSARMDEGRDISRYITQLLVFLGLLGTFYGLLLTVKSIADVISSMPSNGADITMMFEQVKLGLIKPLNGMATAFSGSMFGLAGSLILGFLDLTAGQAQNRFYNELEEWLLSVTQLEHAAHPTPPQGQQGNNLFSENAHLQALNTWLSEIQKTSQINADNLTILQRNLGILRDIALDSNKEKQQILIMLQQLNQHLEQINNQITATSNHSAQNKETTTLPHHSIDMLEKIERQIAGLRDDLRRNQQ